MGAKGSGASAQNALHPSARVKPGSAWVFPLLATMLIQMILALLSRVIPTLAPALLPLTGLNASAVGYFDALNTGAAMAFLVGGHPLIRRSGPISDLAVRPAARQLRGAFASAALLAGPGRRQPVDGPRLWTILAGR